MSSDHSFMTNQPVKSLRDRFGSVLGMMNPRLDAWNGIQDFGNFRRNGRGAVPLVSPDD